MAEPSTSLGLPPQPQRTAAHTVASADLDVGAGEWLFLATLSEAEVGDLVTALARRLLEELRSGQARFDLMVELRPCRCNGWGSKEPLGTKTPSGSNAADAPDDSWNLRRPEPPHRGPPVGGDVSSWCSPAFPMSRGDQLGSRVTRLPAKGRAEPPHQGPAVGDDVGSWCSAEAGWVPTSLVPRWARAAQGSRGGGGLGGAAPIRHEFLVGNSVSGGFQERERLGCGWGRC